MTDSNQTADRKQQFPKSLVVVLGALVAFGPMSIDMYLPSLPAIAESLNANVAYVQLTL